MVLFRRRYTVTIVGASIRGARLDAILTGRCAITFQFLVATPQTRNDGSRPLSRCCVIHRESQSVVAFGVRIEDCGVKYRGAEGGSGAVLCLSGNHV